MIDVVKAGPILLQEAASYVPKFYALNMKCRPPGGISVEMGYAAAYPVNPKS